MPGNRTVVSGVLLIYLALALLVLPLQWVAAVILAMAVHEGSHYLAIRLCGGEIGRFGIGAVGARLEVFHLTPGQELLCALAGPAGGLALLLAARWLPRTALCAALQSVYNLLPVYPLDGGRALRCAAELLLPGQVGERLCVFIEVICLAGMVALGLYGTFILRLGVMPLIFAALLLHRALAGKIACKDGAS